MTEKTIKELLEMEFFPTDDQGRQLVPNSYGDVTIIATDGPGEYPIIGIGPKGYVVQFDETGFIRTDTAHAYSDGVRITIDDDSADRASMIEPEMQRIVQFVVVEADGTVECSYDTRHQAESMSGPSQQIVELDGYGYVREITDASDDEAGQTYSDDMRQPGETSLGAWVRTNYQPEESAPTIAHYPWNKLG